MPVDSFQETSGKTRAVATKTVNYFCPVLKGAKKEVGLWIDHREAVIITVAAEGDAIKRIRSDVEQHSRFSAHARRRTGQLALRRRTAHRRQPAAPVFRRRSPRAIRCWPEGRP